MRERVAAVAGNALFSGMMGLAWPAIAWAVTGSCSAYTDTELAWRAPYIGYQELVPFSAWIQGAEFWMPGPLGIVALVLFVAAVRHPAASCRPCAGSASTCDSGC